MENGLIVWKGKGQVCVGIVPPFGRQDVPYICEATGEMIF